MSHNHPRIAVISGGKIAEVQECGWVQIDQFIVIVDHPQIRVFQPWQRCALRSGQNGEGQFACVKVVQDLLGKGEVFLENLKVASVVWCCMALYHAHPASIWV